MPLRRVLVANRGEIAVRILRACADEHLETVLVVSEADRDSLGAMLADRVVCIGPPPGDQSYLDVARVVQAALSTGCDAVHPGYGFLSERSAFAQACADNDLVFIGPDADTIRRGGDKVEARRLAEDAGVPVGAGSADVADADTAGKVAAGVGYPVLLKAAAGGGGKGMKRVDEPSQMADAFETATGEARQAFGDERVYLERFITAARHVEVQILGDRHGEVIHVGERDCSAQRRYQKLVEEAPAPGLPAALRTRLLEAAVAVGRALAYVGAGTVEFVVDLERETFSFLEVNTRIQVEHPVTELVTGIDLVRAQLRIAAGEPVGVAQEDVTVRGHAIECRINAEDPAAGFAPAPGRLQRWVVPNATDVRTDTHCYPGYLVAPYYDSLLAKVIARGEDRAAAIRRMGQALRQLTVEGVATTTPLHRDLIAHSDFAAGRIHTRWVEETFLPTWMTGSAA